MDEENETENKTTDTGQVVAAADWAELNHDCLISIISRLSVEDRWRGALRVCKSWHHACKDSCLNSVLDIESYFDSITVLHRLWTPELERRVDNMLRSVVVWSAGGLTEIRVRHCSDRSLALVAKRCPNLEVLSIKCSPHATDAIMAEIASGCPKIKELDISYCYEISEKSLAIIGSLCPNMAILKRSLMDWLDLSENVGIVPYKYLNTCPTDGDSEAAAISKFMPHLLHLELRLSNMTAKGLSLISQGCQDLEYVDLTGWINVTLQDVFIASSNLKKLKIMKKPDFYIPRRRSDFHEERYDDWKLYSARYQTFEYRMNVMNVM